MWKAKREAPPAFKRSRTTKGKNLLVRWYKNPRVYPKERSCSTTDKGAREDKEGGLLRRREVSFSLWNGLSPGEKEKKEKGPISKTPAKTQK